MPVRSSPTPAVTPSVMLSPIVPSFPTVSMQHCNDRVAFRINNKDHAIHALPIGSWNSVSQSKRLSATDHERSTSVAHERAAVSIGVDCLHDAHRNPPRLCALARMIGQDWPPYC